ncbi:MAG: hypothetical protein HKL85_12525 [Acidimicrobiaceae bacterium]|nr:hypothetical protein [Acidimicrobiaceae bacterium]
MEARNYGIGRWIGSEGPLRGDPKRLCHVRSHTPANWKRRIKCCQLGHAFAFTTRRVSSLRLRFSNLDTYLLHLTSMQRACNFTVDPLKTRRSSAAVGYLAVPRLNHYRRAVGILHNDERQLVYPDPDS